MPFEHPLERRMPIPTHCPCGMRLVRKPMARNQRFCSLRCFRKAQATLRDLKRLGIKPRYEWVKRDGVDMFMLAIPGIGENFFKPWKRKQQSKLRVT
jgi:hypothetical protein